MGQNKGLPHSIRHQNDHDCCHRMDKQHSNAIHPPPEFRGRICGRHPRTSTPICSSCGHDYNHALIEDDRFNHNQADMTQICCCF